MPRCVRLVVPVVVVLTAACELPHAAPDGRDAPHATAAIEETPPTQADAASATYWGGQAREITLVEGTFTGPEGQRVELIREHYVVGDLEGDGAVDAVVALRVTNAGAEDGDYVAVLRHLGTNTVSLGTAVLPPGAQVRRLTVDGRRVLVHLTDDESTGNQPLTYELRRGGLVRLATTAR